jgi:hypothetical protein
MSREVPVRFCERMSRPTHPKALRSMLTHLIFAAQLAPLLVI